MLLVLGVGLRLGAQNQTSGHIHQTCIKFKRSLQGECVIERNYNRNGTEKITTK